MTHLQYYGLDLEIVDVDERLVRVTSVIDYMQFQFSVALFRPGDRVLVSGGVNGTLALAVAMHVGASNTVFYEPNRPFADGAADQLRVDGAALEVVWGALDVREGTRRIFIREPWGTTSFTPSDHIAGMSVPTKHINDVIAWKGITALSLDVEGAEFDLIQHLDLHPIRALMIVIHAREEDADSLIANVETQGFRRVLWHAEDAMSVVGLRRPD